MMFERQRGNIPAVIYRPAIITAAWKEPMPGWIDSFAAAAQMTISAGLGLVTHLLCKPERVVDLIPVDLVANSIIVAAHA